MKTHEIFECICSYPVSIYLFKVNNGNTSAMCQPVCKIRSTSTLVTPERHHDVILASLLLTWKNVTPCSGVFPLLTLSK